MTAPVYIGNLGDRHEEAKIHFEQHCHLGAYHTDLYFLGSTSLGNDCPSSGLVLSLCIGQPSQKVDRRYLMSKNDHNVLAIVVLILFALWAGSYLGDFGTILCLLLGFIVLVGNRTLR